MRGPVRQKPHRNQRALLQHGMVPAQPQVTMRHARRHRMRGDTDRRGQGGTGMTRQFYPPRAKPAHHPHAAPARHAHARPQRLHRHFAGRSQDARAGGKARQGHQRAARTIGGEHQTLRGLGRPTGINAAERHPANHRLAPGVGHHQRARRDGGEIDAVAGGKSGHLIGRRGPSRFPASRPRQRRWPPNRRPPHSPAPAFRPPG